MTIAEVVITLFLVLEISNVIAMYFFTESKMANSVGVFRAWENSKRDPDIHDFVRYLVYWVAGSKLVFILLLLVILIQGTPVVQRASLVVLGVAALSFYWRLYPLIRKMDRKQEIDPASYSRRLGIMIAIFIGVFWLAALAPL